MTREQVLLDALEKVSGEREQDYGRPENSFRGIANLWNEWLSARGLPGTTIITPADVAAMMALMKLARLSNNMGHRDSWVDLAGYAACGAEIVDPTREQLELELKL